MADHRHVQMLIESIHRKWISGVGRRREAVFYSSNPDYVRGMSASSTFRMIHMNCAPVYGCQGIFQKTTFVQRIGMQLHLEIQFVCNGKAGINNRRHRAPILVDLHTETAARYLIVN